MDDAQKAAVGMIILIYGGFFLCFVGGICCTICLVCHMCKGDKGKKLNQKKQGTEKTTETQVTINTQQ